MGVGAKILEDVVNLDGNRLTIYEATIHRVTLAELNTHRKQSRSSASNRAVPIEKNLARVFDEPALPVIWASEQPGMQGGEELSGPDLQDAQDLFERLRDFTVDQIQDYLDAHPDKSTRLHKSWLNRPLEWFSWHTVIIGATDDGWDNLFRQRATSYSPLALPEFRAYADIMLDLYRENTPRLILPGEWVTPYIQPAEEFVLEERKQVSAARCARVSYLNHDGVRDVGADIDLFKKLASADPMHAAPLEFVATPLVGDMEPMGNFTGYRQFRHVVQKMVTR